MVVRCILLRSYFSVVVSYKCRRVPLRLSGLYDSSCSTRSFVVSSRSFFVVLPCLVPGVFTRFSVSSFVRFPSELLDWSVASSARRLISVVSFLVASGSRSLPASLRSITMSDKVDELTDMSPSALMSGVTATIASSVEPISAPVDPTMAALFDTVRARSSASVAPPSGPVSTPLGYVCFTGIVRRSVGVTTNDPEGVVHAPAETSDRLLKSILKRPGWAECALIGFSWDDVRESQRSEIVRIRQVAESVGSSATVHTGRYLDLVEGSFVIPPAIRCERMFLLYGSDAKYVNSMEQYLFGGHVGYPGLADRSLRDVVIRSGDVPAWKKSYSVTNGSRVCVPYRDFSVLRGKVSHAYDVMMAGGRKILRSCCCCSLVSLRSP